ncbi:hypothetical protein GA0116948_105236 [Chitinophaga costaii]|uniref:Uncharacterized protein n=1 Tax=Chitinophaga costaii TaxID=1335309 RepID=A0A1C4DF27_9BACT|nr:hypothetical protein GA0116948_105236 [Chitinophaga costaii]
MKKVFYSALAVTTAIAGIAASKANNNTHRSVYLYRYIGSRPVTTASQVTNVTNWTVTTTALWCTGTLQPCGVTTTIPPSATSNHPSAKIPPIFTGAFYYTANTGSFPSGTIGASGTNVIASYSEDL